MKKKILILPHSMRIKFFDDIKRSLKKHDVLIFRGEKEDINNYEIDLKNQDLFFPSKKKLFNFLLTENISLKNEIKKLEQNLSISLNRILLSNERDIGYFYSSNSYSFVREKLFCNKHNKLKISSVLTQGANLIQNFLKKEKFDLIISGNNASFYYFLCSLFSKSMKIPFIVSRRSKIIKKYFYWSKDHFMWNEKLEYDFKRNLKKKPSSEAFKFINSFRRVPKTVSFVEENWNNKKKFYTNNIKNILNIIVNNTLQIFNKKIIRIPLFPRIKNFLITAINRTNFSMYKDYTDKELVELNYIYFPLHKEPELAQNFLDPHIYNQYEVVKLLSLFIPFNCKLFVKEHRLNHGRRTKEFLEKITNLHNVEIINPFENQFKYLKNAKLVVADNGTSGWEAMILKTPVLNISKAFYDVIVKNRNKDFSVMDSDILNVLKKKQCPSDFEIASLYDAEKNNCYKESLSGIKKSLNKIISKI